jgi:hypothetical protein
MADGVIRMARRQRWEMGRDGVTIRREIEWAGEESRMVGRGIYV